ncbi:MAG: hypothetical protein AAB300_02600 [Nitrospirota bacterium]
MDEKTIEKNLYAWAELTDLCLCLKRSVLALTIPKENVEEALFRGIREYKEEQWRTSRT